MGQASFGDSMAQLLQGTQMVQRGRRPGTERHGRIENYTTRGGDLMRLQRKPPTPEALVKRSIRNFLRTMGVFHFPVLQGLGCYPGVSDFLGIYKGRMLAIEAKAGKNNPSPDQVAFLERIKQEGGIGIVARSVDDVIDGLGLQDRFLL